MARHSPLATSQMRTVLSWLPDATCVPSLLYATLLTLPVWPCGKTEGASTTSTLSPFGAHSPHQGL
eukprot:7914800-Pyramimonas_sp.AAC.1